MFGEDAICFDLIWEACFGSLGEGIHVVFRSLDHLVAVDPLAKVSLCGGLAENPLISKKVKV